MYRHNLLRPVPAPFILTELPAQVPRGRAVEALIPHDNVAESSRAWSVMGREARTNRQMLLLEGQLAVLILPRLRSRGHDGYARARSRGQSEV